MKRRPLLLLVRSLFLFTLVSCMSSEGSELIGHWRGYAKVARGVVLKGEDAWAAEICRTSVLDLKPAGEYELLIRGATGARQLGQWDLKGGQVILTPSHASGAATSDRTVLTVKKDEQSQVVLTSDVRPDVELGFSR